jgi:hypothetical protein
VKRASEFYESKVKELGGNVQGLEGIVQDKSQSLRVVEEGELCRSLRIASGILSVPLPLTSCSSIEAKDACQPTRINSIGLESSICPSCLVRSYDSYLPRGRYFLGRC